MVYEFSSKTCMFAKTGMEKLSRKAEGKGGSGRQVGRKGGRKKQGKRWGSLDSLRHVHMASFYRKMKLTPVLLWLPRVNLGPILLNYVGLAKTNIAFNLLSY